MRESAPSSSKEIRWKTSIHCPDTVQERLKKGHGNYGQGLKRSKCKACGRTFNDKTGTISQPAQA
ncbi:MAG: hypothetical protein QXR19_08640 [Candidatus Jordarchaeaceae archaeon]